MIEGTEGGTSLMYSPVHVVIVILYVDPNGAKFGWGLGPKEAYGIFNIRSTSDDFHSIRYEKMVSIFSRVVANTRNDIDYPIRTVWPRMRQPREVADNETYLVMPIAHLINPRVRQCIDNLDRAALVQKIQTSNRDPQYPNWFTSMFIGNAIPDGKGGTTILFVNKRDGRIHLFVPATMQGGRCVPGEPFIKLI